MTFETEPARVQEDVIRGTLFALIVIPVGAAAWTAVSSIGLVTSLLAFGIAWAAVWLYRRGSGGIISRSGAIAVTVIVIVTLGLGFFGALVERFALALGRQYDISQFDALGRPNFWPLFNYFLPELVKDDALYLVLGLVVAILGSYRILRRAYRTPHAVPAELPE